VDATEEGTRARSRQAVAPLRSPRGPSRPLDRSGRFQAGMSDEEERKLVYGLLFSIKNICDKLSDSPSG